MEAVTPNIFSYSDVRAYLRDYYEVRHQCDRLFSHRFIANALSDKSPSFLQKVIQNERSLTPHQIEALIRMFGLLEHEGRYFRVLYLYSTASNQTERELYLEQLISLNHTPRTEVQRNQLEYYRHWFNPVIRTLLSCIDFSDDPAKLVRLIRPKITLGQAKKSLQLLERLGLIKQNADGFWKPLDENLFVKDAFQDGILQSYRHQCLELASSAVDEATNNHDFHFSTLTMSVSEGAHRRIQAKLDKFRAEVRSIVSKDPDSPSKVLQLQNQIFPVVQNLD